MDLIRWGYFNTQFGLIGPVSQHFDKFGPIQKFRISAEDLSQVFLQDLPKIKSSKNCQLAGDLISFGHYDSQFGLIGQFSHNLNRIWPD